MSHCRSVSPLSQSPSVFVRLRPSSAGMTVEMVAMLVASAIQGQVVAVYNTEKQEVCHQHQEQEAPEGAPSPQADSLHQTVNTLELSFGTKRLRSAQVS